MTSQPRGYAATAAEFLDVSAEDTDAGDLAIRQLAATQAIGYALLALGDQLADLTDANADHTGQLGEIAGYVADLYREPLGSRAFGAVRRLARRACLGAARDVAGTPGGIAAASSGPGKNGVARYAEQWLREHPGGLVGVYDLEDVHGLAAYEALRRRMAGGAR